LGFQEKKQKVELFLGDFVPFVSGLWNDALSGLIGL
jgi:hypothetical protein